MCGPSARSFFRAVMLVTGICLAMQGCKKEEAQVGDTLDTASGAAADTAAEAPAELGAAGEAAADAGEAAADAAEAAGEAAQAAPEDWEHGQTVPDPEDPRPGPPK